MSGTEAGGLASAPVAASGVSRIALTRPMVRIAQLAIGVILLWASLGKIGDMSEFAREVHNFHLSPLWAEHLIAMTLPWVELTAGLALVTGLRARAGAVLALALMVLFTIAVGAAWARGLDFRCGCFGKASAATIGPAKFVENVGFALLAAIAALRPRG
ncbi:MAG TPA: MauE/DoxX family redox-associated membrane protein [Dongiaceae bacterium]|nr:MauE/DoxX family redox-associated membrane protein [Dongiaceae bacterium]